MLEGEVALKLCEGGGGNDRAVEDAFGLGLQKLNMPGPQPVVVLQPVSDRILNPMRDTTTQENRDIVLRMANAPL